MAFHPIIGHPRLGGQRPRQVPVALTTERRLDRGKSISGNGVFLALTLVFVKKVGVFIVLYLNSAILRVTYTLD